MFFLFGMRTKAKAIAQQERACTKCVRPTMHALVETKKWFTLFFIPVIPLGGSLFARCGVCGLSTKCASDAKDQISANAMAAKA
jgi:zinc-ribbon family